jgi:hypothetical protein
MMSRHDLDVQDKLQYARCAVAVLRTLKILDAKMSRHDFARAIGLVGSGFVGWDELQLDDILCITAAVERLKIEGLKSANNVEPLEYERIKFCEGDFRNSRIVKE